MKGQCRSVLPSSVTVALLKAVRTVRSLKEVSMDLCDFGMQCVHVLSMCVDVTTFDSAVCFVLGPQLAMCSSALHLVSPSMTTCFPHLQMVLMRKWRHLPVTLRHAT